MTNPGILYPLANNAPLDLLVDFEKRRGITPDTVYLNPAAIQAAKDFDGLVVVQVRRCIQPGEVLIMRAENPAG